HPHYRLPRGRPKSCRRGSWRSWIGRFRLGEGTSRTGGYGLSLFTRAGGSRSRVAGFTQRLTGRSAPFLALSRQGRGEKSGRWCSALVGHRDGVEDHLAGIFDIADAVDLGPFAGLKVLVVHEEVLDALDLDFRQIGDVADAVIHRG